MVLGSHSRVRCCGRLKRMGFGIQCSSLRHTSAASLVRNALKTLSNFEDVQRYQKQTWQLDDMTLVPSEKEWLNNNCFTAMTCAIEQCRTLGIDVQEVCARDKPQAIISNRMVELEPFCAAGLLTRRLRRFFPNDDHEFLVPSILDQYRVFLKSFKGCFVTSHLRICFNQWCTPRRFGQDQIGCPYKCGSNENSIEHCLVCDKLQEVIHGVFRDSSICFFLADVVFFRHWAGG